MSAIDRRRLARLLGMVGSTHDGEALNAARLADRLVRNEGLTWPQVLDVPPEEDPLADWPGGWRNAVTTCLRYGDGVLTSFDRQFCRNLDGYVGDCTIKQRHVLRRILDKVVAAGVVR